MTSPARRSSVLDSPGSSPLRPLPPERMGGSPAAVIAGAAQRAAADVFSLSPRQLFPAPALAERQSRIPVLTDRPLSRVLEPSYDLGVPLLSQEEMDRRGLRLQDAYRIVAGGGPSAEAFTTDQVVHPNRLPDDYSGFRLADNLRAMGFEQEADQLLEQLNEAGRRLVGEENDDPELPEAPRIEDEEIADPESEEEQSAVLVGLEAERQRRLIARARQEGLNDLADQYEEALRTAGYGVDVPQGQPPAAPVRGGEGPANPAAGSVWDRLPPRREGPANPAAVAGARAMLDGWRQERLAREAAAAPARPPQLLGLGRAENREQQPQRERLRQLLAMPVPPATAEQQERARERTQQLLDRLGVPRRPR